MIRYVATKMPDILLLSILLLSAAQLFAGDWDILNGGEHGNLNAVDFVNQNTGWMIGHGF